MSAWTHVSAIFRVEYADDRTDWDALFGREVEQHADGDDSDAMARLEDEWEAYDADHAAFMPTGSEGSLHREVIRNPDHNQAVTHTVVVTGDLRDYRNVRAVGEWFEDVCSKIAIRQASCHAFCERPAITADYMYQNGTMHTNLAYPLQRNLEN